MAKGALTRTTLAERDKVAETLTRTDETRTRDLYREGVGRDNEQPTGAVEAEPDGRRIGVRVATAEFTMELADGQVKTDARNYTAPPSDTLLKARDAKHSAFRTTMQLRAMAQKIGINPVETLLWMSAGLAPKYTAVRDADGNMTLMPVLDQDGNQAFAAMIPTEQLVAAKEASKYLYPQLKSVELGKDLTDGTVADEQVDNALKTFASIARLALGPNSGAKVVAVLEGEMGEEEE